MLAKQAAAEERLTYKRMPIAETSDESNTWFQNYLGSVKCTTR